MKKKDVRAVRQKPSRLRKVDKELLWIVGVMIGLLAVFFVSYAIFKNINHFEYQGLSFTKEKYGEIPVYHYYYYFQSEKGSVVKYNLYLRNDPRKSNVSVNGTIDLVDKSKVYLSVNGTGLDRCPSAGVGVATLASFLTDNEVNVKAATNDREIANVTKTFYATCNNYPESTVILVQEGNESKIVREKNKCYVLTISNCEVLPVVEKFEVQSIIDAKIRNEALKEDGPYYSS